MNFIRIFFIVILTFSFSAGCGDLELHPDWYPAGENPDDYEMGGNPLVEHGKRKAGYIKTKLVEIDGFGTYMTDIPATQYIGNYIKLTAYIKTEDVENWVGLWMRVDGAYDVLSFDNMHDRPITGSTGWNLYEVILYVPEGSLGIYYGILLDGTGQASIDGLTLTPVLK